jgi:hypothetical protein
MWMWRGWFGLVSFGDKCIHVVTSDQGATKIFRKEIYTIERCSTVHKIQVEINRNTPVDDNSVVHRP